ncbi:MAG: YihY/virulence factor BrkB family protein [Bacteroidota bacterium]
MSAPSFARLRAVIVATVRDVLDDDVPSLAAAIAYYTVFSLPPLLVILVALAGAVYGPDRVSALLAEQAVSSIGPGAGEAIRAMIENSRDVGTGVGAQVIGVVALLFGASGAFGQLQKALNRAWEVDSSGDGGGLVRLIAKRLLSFGMVLTVAFLLLVSLAVSTALGIAGDAAAGVAGEGAIGLGVRVLNAAVSLGVVAGLFAVLFKVLPDAEIAWRDVAIGAVVTAVLFTVGKGLIGFYLAQADPGSAFGAAGSLALVLVWVYYSALIVLVGAEFTQAWAQQVGSGIQNEGDTPHHETAPAGEVHPMALPREPAPYSNPAP